MSSSAPGASPTNIRSASGLPTPNTTCRRPSVCSLQRVQSPMSLADRGQRVGRTLEQHDARPPASRHGLGSRAALLAGALRRPRSRLTPATPSSDAKRRCSMRDRGSMPADAEFRSGEAQSASALLVVSGFSRTCASAELLREQRLDAIEDRHRDAVLRLQRQRFRAVGADDRHRVGVDVEARRPRATRRWRRSGRRASRRAWRRRARRRPRSRRRSRRAADRGRWPAGARRGRRGCPASS